MQPLTMQPLIEVRNLTKKFEDFAAVDGIDLQVRKGEFLTLLGSSGSGKTTTLRLIAGLEQPTCGSILYQGRDITGVPTRLRDMRMVFQDYALFPHLNVFDNVAFGLRLRATRAGFGPERVSALVGRHLDFVHLAGQQAKFPHQLSGGQRQRVALARALVSDPPVVLFDEPLGSLDASLRKAMQFELKRIHRQLGKTFIYVTHDQEEAMAMSDRIVVMKDARILQVDTPEKLYDEPATSAVARFVGAANVLGATVEAIGADRVTVRLGSGRLEAPRPAGSLAQGERVLVALRGEGVELLATGAAADAAQAGLRGVVAGCSFLGRSVEYQVDLGGPDGMLTVVSARSRTLHAVGDEVLARVGPDGARVLAS